MRDAQGLYLLVYRFYRARIESGQCAIDTPLPSALEMSAAFEVSLSTVRKALQALKDEGYISLSPGRTARVCWGKCLNSGDFTPLQERFDSLLDMYDAMSYIQPPLFVQGVPRLTDEDILELESAVRGIENQNVSSVFEFLAVFLRPLSNTMTTRLLFEVDHFVHAAFNGNNINSIILNKKRTAFSTSSNIYRRITAAASHRDYEAAEPLFFELTGIYRRQMRDLLLSGKFHQSTQKRREFKWLSFHESEQYSYSTVVEIMHRICEGEFHNGWLPPISDIAQDMKVSEITVRRAVQMLDKLGFTQTIKRRGIKVLGADRQQQPGKLKIKLIRAQLIFGLELLQFLAFTTHEVSVRNFPLFTDDLKGKAIRLLKRDIALGEQSYSLSALIRLICQSTDNSVIREIYTGICGRLVWLYPLRLISFGDLRINELVPTLENIIASLRENEAQTFAENTGALMTNVFAATREAIIGLGIKEAAEIQLPYKS